MGCACTRSSGNQSVSEDVILVIGYLGQQMLPCFSHAFHVDLGATYLLHPENKIKQPVAV